MLKRILIQNKTKILYDEITSERLLIISKNIFGNKIFKIPNGSLNKISTF